MRFVLSLIISFLYDWIYFYIFFLFLYLSFRFAQRKDAALIFDFIMRIAEYEKMTDEVLNTPEMVEKQLFDEHRAEVIFAMADGREVGFELFFYNYSTFTGKPGILLIGSVLIAGKTFFDYLEYSVEVVIRKISYHM